jgi:hypothetical protein
MITNLSRRPNTLGEISLRHNAGKQNWTEGLSEFLDAFYYAKESEKQFMIQNEPTQINTLADAYLAGVAELLSAQYYLDAPGWINNKERFLHSAHFSGGLESLKAILLVESPAAFRKRMIFTEKDPLSRASRYSPEANPSH